MTTSSAVPRCVEIPRPDRAPSGARLRVLWVPPERISSVRVANLPLGMHAYEDALAFPVADLPGADRLVGAVYDRFGNLIGASQRARPGLRWRSNPKMLTDLDSRTADEALHLPGRTYFGGQLGHVFGHVLLETLARFWRDLDYASYDQVVVYPIGQPAREIVVPELTLQVLALVGVRRERVHVVQRRLVRFDLIDVVPSPIRLVKTVDPRMLAVFDRIANAVAPVVVARDAPRIYLSRSRLADGRRATNESEIEAMMTARGFAVIHPQQLPLLEQIALARRAEIIAGCDGSALHIAAFARPGTRLLALDSRPTPNQVLIGWARGLDAVHVDALAGDRASRTDAWTANLDRVRDAVDLRLAAEA